MKKNILFGCLFFLLFNLVNLSFAAERSERSEWKEYKKNHFIVYYKKAPLNFVEAVQKNAERYYEEVAKNLGFTRYKGWIGDERGRIYIYDNSDDYIQNAGQAQWSHGVASPQERIIKTYPAAQGFFDTVLPHELGHIVFREMVGFKTEQIPLWFEEGVAIYQEQAKRWGSHDAVRQAIDDGTFVPLNQLTLTHLRQNTDQDQVELFYAESASVVNYLITELGQYRFVRFCRELEDGSPFEWALDQVYTRFKNVEALNQAWIQFLKQ